MNCPVCGGGTVIRGSKTDCEGVHRRRVCVDCKYVFYTSEYESDGEEFRRLRSVSNNSRYYKNYQWWNPKKRKKNGKLQK